MIARDDYLKEYYEWFDIESISRPSSISQFLRNLIFGNYMPLRSAFIQAKLNIDEKTFFKYYRQSRFYSFSKNKDVDYNNLIQRAIDFYAMVDYCIWNFPEYIPYEQRDVFIRFDDVVPISIQDDIINLYRRASYDYGLRIRRCDGYYYVYWDKIQLNNKRITDFRLDGTTCAQRDEELIRILR